MAGKSFYAPLGGVLLPKTHEELMALVVAVLQPQSKEGALMYGNYLNTFGHDFKRYVPEGLFEGKFNGQAVKENIILEKSWEIFQSAKGVYKYLGSKLNKVK